MKGQNTAKIISGHPAATASDFVTVQVKEEILGIACPDGSKLYLEPVQKKEIEKTTKLGYYCCLMRNGNLFLGEFKTLSEMQSQAVAKIVKLWRWKGQCSIPVI